MPQRLTALLLISFLMPAISFSQLYVKGKVYNAKGDEVLQYVTVRNISAQKNNTSDVGGNFRIQASEGDTLIFSASSFLSDTLKIDYFMLHNVYDVSLMPRTTTLSSVTVSAQDKYVHDSLERHEYYKDALKKKSIVDKNPPTDGVGIRLGLDFLSKNGRQKRAFRKELLDEDKEDYINSKFSYAYVGKLTGLKNDSLRAFLELYRPTYKFCRHATQPDMVAYISDCMQKFKKRKTLYDEDSFLPLSPRPARLVQKIKALSNPDMNRFAPFAITDQNQKCFCQNQTGFAQKQIVF